MKHHPANVVPHRDRTEPEHGGRHSLAIRVSHLTVDHVDRLLEIWDSFHEEGHDIETWTSFSSYVASELLEALGAREGKECAIPPLPMSYFGKGQNYRPAEHRATT